jgi:hypothetical protein
MAIFPIRTFTIINDEQHSILHSPALPRVGVPYLDVTDSATTKLVVRTHEGATREAIFSEEELRITVEPGEFERFERALLAAPRESNGRLFPYSVITDPPRVDFETDNGLVVRFTLPE